jgi:hypothetical protein
MNHTQMPMQIEYLNLGMVNETRVAMEVEPTLEEEIQEGQLEDAKLKEIRPQYPMPKPSAPLQRTSQQPNRQGVQMQLQ